MRLRAGWGQDTGWTWDIHPVHPWMSTPPAEQGSPDPPPRASRCRPQAATRARACDAGPRGPRAQRWATWPLARRSGELARCPGEPGHAAMLASRSRCWTTRTCWRGARGSRVTRPCWRPARDGGHPDMLAPRPGAGPPGHAVRSHARLAPRPGRGWATRPCWRPPGLSWATTGEHAGDAWPGGWAPRVRPRGRHARGLRRPSHVVLSRACRVPSPWSLGS